jgi:hypothetical protein
VRKFGLWRKPLKGQVFADDEKTEEMKLQGNKHILDSQFECSKKYVNKFIP